MIIAGTSHDLKLLLKQGINSVREIGVSAVTTEAHNNVFLFSSDTDNKTIWLLYVSICLTRYVEPRGQWIFLLTLFRSVLLYRACQKSKNQP